MMQIRRSAFLLAASANVALFTLSGCGKGYEADSPNVTATETVMDPSARKLASAWNGSWITLSGRVVSAGPDRFQLDYGSGRITVEMDDWDWYHEGKALLAGDQVTVTGRIDRDFYEQKKIEASSVYVASLGTSFHANPDDEEDFVGASVGLPAAPNIVGVSGTVSDIQGRRFNLGEPNANLLVDTSKMIDNPLDTVGRFQVKAGDRVQVWGRLTVRPNEPAEILADKVVIQRKDRTKQRNNPVATDQPSPAAANSTDGVGEPANAAAAQGTDSTGGAAAS